MGWEVQIVRALLATTGLVTLIIVLLRGLIRDVIASIRELRDEWRSL